MLPVFVVRGAEKQKTDFCLSAMFILAPSILIKVLEIPLEASGNAQGADHNAVCLSPAHRCVQACARLHMQIHTQAAAAVMAFCV